MTRDTWETWAIELQSLAQAGLYFTKDVYDKERFERIREIAAEMMSEGTGFPTEKVKTLFCNDTGYQTPKVETRAAIFKDNQILLVKENDGLWSLPGGWCDVNLSPVENTMKEAKEESGRDIRVQSLIAVQNRDFHNLPPFAYGVVKIFYLCEELGGEFIENSETTEADYFSQDNLPVLSQGKNTPDQVNMCFEAYRSESWQTVFD